MKVSFHTWGFNSYENSQDILISGLHRVLKVNVEDRTIFFTASSDDSEKTVRILRFPYYGESDIPDGYEYAGTSVSRSLVDVTNTYHWFYRVL